jgi:hypothetical protein
MLGTCGTVERSVGLEVFLDESFGKMFATKQEIGECVG